MLLHRGGQYVSLDDLQAVPLPEETSSYKPVSHHDLATNIAKVCGDLLNDYALLGCQYGLARKGFQLFAIHTYRHLYNDELGLSIGFRNSYDKSMSVGIAIGASVFVCDNLALTGEIAIMRKHTMNVWNDLEETIITTIYKSQNNFFKIVEDAEVMKSVEMCDDDAFRAIGLLFGRKVLTPRQLPIVKKEWLNPKHSAFQLRNAWSFYNSCTEALKKCPPNQIMEKHIALHKQFTNGSIQEAIFNPLSY